MIALPISLQVPVFLRMFKVKEGCCIILLNKKESVIGVIMVKFFFIANPFLLPRSTKYNFKFS